MRLYTVRKRKLHPSRSLSQGTENRWGLGSVSKIERRIKMKFLKRKGDETTIRKVWNDDKTILYGVVGTVEDMLKVGLLEYCG